MSTTYVEPRTDDEKLIAKIWAEGLGTDKISILENIFDLEGDSLMFTQIAKRMQDEMGVSLTIRDMFNLPTIAALSEHVAKLRRTSPSIRSYPPKVSKREA